MTFKTIALKNFKHHLRKYISYFLCSSFSIMIFFMYSTLFFNTDLNQEEGFRLILGTGMFSVSVFAIFFVSYAHSAFIKSRHKEFGVYMTLGMSPSHIRKMILFENACVIFSSLCFGLCSGLLFSRLFQMIALKLLGIDGFSYSMNYKSFVLTIGVFSAIFLFVIILSRFSIRNLDISGFFQRARKTENHKRYSLFIGIIGVLLILASSLLHFYIYYRRDFGGYGSLQLLSLFLSFSGIYLVISNLGNGILQFIKKNPSLYYKNLLTATEINQKFNQNKKILLVLSILSTMIILFVGMTFSMYSQSKNMSLILQPSNIEYIELSTINKVFPDVLNQVIHSGKTPLTNQKSMEFLSLNIVNNTDPDDLLESRPFVSQSTYNEATQKKLNVKNGEAISIIIPGSQVISEYKPQLGILELQLSEDTYELYSSKILHSKWISGLSLYPSKVGMVISDEDYNAIRKKISSDQIGQYHSFNFQDWEKTKQTVTQLRTILESKNKATNAENANLFAVASTVEFYEMFKHSYSLGIFILSIIGILFFIASINVLYFKQFTEISSAREKFYKLYKIGITEKEIIGVISKEMRLIFFTPLILAVIPGLSNIWFSNSMLGGQEIILKLMLSASAIVAIYFLLQSVLYMVIKRAYCSQILKTL